MERRIEQLVKRDKRSQEILVDDKGQNREANVQIIESQTQRGSKKG